jgi:xanthine/CO dehydrogenase XdhC/CoxF family maturation factor
VLDYRRCDPSSTLRLNRVLDLNEEDLAVVLTHSYEQDEAILRALLPLSLRYLGILGPLHRTKHLITSIAPFLALSEDECFSRLRAPIGLDIGGEDPGMIALSIIAEIQAELMGRTVQITRDLSGTDSERSIDVEIEAMA